MPGEYGGSPDVFFRGAVDSAGLNVETSPSFGLSWVGYFAPLLSAAERLPHMLHGRNHAQVVHPHGTQNGDHG